MEEGTPYIELRISTRDPVDLHELVAAFASIASTFQRFIRERHVNLDGHARLYVNKIREGSMIVELFPAIAPLVANMDLILIVDGFVRRYGGLLNSYIEGERKENATKAELRDVIGAVALIANDQDGKSAISTVQVLRDDQTSSAGRGLQP